MNTVMPGVDGAGYIASTTSGPIRSGRRLYRLIAIVTAVMMVVGGFALMPVAVSADAGEPTQTTDRLKLRAGPALNSDILNVMPVGAAVEIVGEPENGFYPVSWEGQTGYAYSAYLTAGATGEGPAVTGGQTGEVNVVDGPVNFRSGPSMADPVISVIPDGALVALNGDSANGFVAIIYTDRSGWAHAGSVLGTGEEVQVDEPVIPEAPVETEEPEAPSMPEGVAVGDTATGTATVVDGGLNLRTGPSLDYAVVMVMPDGAAVELRGEPQNGYYPVSHAGETGWASAEFLQLAGEEPAESVQTETPVATETPVTTEPPVETESTVETETEVPTEEPVAPPVDGSDGYTEDEIIQIIYAAADAYGQPREDMLRVARCESVLDPTAVNPESQASGLFQFLPSTWETTPYADEDIFDPVASANAAAWMWSEGRRNEWVCQ